VERLHSPFIGYDTVKLWSNMSDNDFKAFEKRMMDFDKIEKKWGSLSASCKNLRFTLFENSNRVFVEGSIPKFFTGQNIITTLPNNMRDGIGILSDTFSIDFSIGGVSVIDLAVTLQMEEPPVNYYSMLLKLDGYKREIVTGKSPTLQFSKGSEGNGYSYEKLYDKGIESGIDGNWLRIENSNRGKLRQQFKTGERIDATMLYNPDFFNSICKKMIQNIENIKIVNPVGWNALPEHPTQKDFARIAQIRGIQLERDIIFETINSTVYESPRDKSRVMKWFNESMASGMHCSDLDHIKRMQELCGKIKRLKSQYL